MIVLKPAACVGYTLALGIGAALLSVPPAFAQDSVAARVDARLSAASEKLKTGCNLDLQKFCGTVTPGGGRLLLCVMAHEDKLSSKCDYTLYQASRHLERAFDRVSELADACWEDIEAKCAGTPLGEGHVAECLASNRTSLTATCQRAIKAVSPGR
jgi:hypothetical protein